MILVKKGRLGDLFLLINFQKILYNFEKCGIMKMPNKFNSRIMVSFSFME